MGRDVCLCGCILFGLAVWDALKRITCCRVPIFMVTDAASLLNIIIQSSQTSKRSIMIDIAATKEAYERMWMDETRWIRALHNIADALTSPLANKNMDKLIKLGYLRQYVTQWMIRSPGNISKSKVNEDQNRLWSDDSLHFIVHSFVQKSSGSVTVFCSYSSVVRRQINGSS